MEYDDIKTLHHEYGVPLNALAKMRGVSRQAVHGRFVKKGWKTYPDNPHERNFLRVAPTVYKLIHKYGIGLADIARIMGMTKHSLWTLTNKYKDKFDTDDNPNQGSRLPKKKKDIAYKAYNGSLTQGEIAYLLGCSQAAVSSIVLKRKKEESENDD